MDEIELPYQLRREFRRAHIPLRTGNPREAERRLKTITEKAPGFALGWHLRAIAAYQSGEFETAARAFIRARQIAPDRPELAIDYGRFLAETQKQEAALEVFLDAAKLPGLSETLILETAEMLTSLKRPELAASCLETFFTSHPYSEHICIRLVMLLEEIGENEKALKILEEAHRVSPNNTNIIGHFIPRLRIAGQHDAADIFSRNIIVNGSAPGYGWLDLAVSAAQRGDRENAVRCARESLKSNPDMGHAAFLLASIGKLPDAFLGDVLSRGTGSMMRFSHARILDRMGLYTESWREYETANEMAIDEDGAYDFAGQEAYTIDLVRNLDKTFVSRLAADPGEKHATQPVFICGVARTGTTLIEQMLASHPSATVRAGGEMRTIHRLLRKEFCTSPPSNVGTRLANLPDRRLQALATSWRNSLRSEYGGYRWIVDKMPSNVFLLGLVHVSFPDAPIVLVERDPVALACSCFVTPFSEGQYFSRRIETIVHYFAKFRQILRHWESVLPTGRILRIRYEDVLIDTEAALSPLLDRMSLCWERDMLNFHQRSDPVTTASLFQVRRALDPSATDRWRRFEPQLGPWRERLEQAYWHGEIMSDDIVAR